jgi:hypothetical protein
MTGLDLTGFGNTYSVYSSLSFNYTFTSVPQTVNIISVSYIHHIPIFPKKEINYINTFPYILYSFLFEAE